MAVTKYYIPGFDAGKFLQQIQGAILPLVSPYRKLSLAQRAVLCEQVSLATNLLLGVEPEDRMDVVRYFNSELLKPAHREYIKAQTPHGVSDAFCVACGQTLPP